MDTYAAVQRLQAHGLTVEQAEDILAVLQDALAPVPSQPELRAFVLEQDRNLERLRGEMHQEFSRLRSDLLPGIRSRPHRPGGVAPRTRRLTRAGALRSLQETTLELSEYDDLIKHLVAIARKQDRINDDIRAAIMQQTTISRRLEESTYDIKSFVQQQGTANAQHTAVRSAHRPHPGSHRRETGALAATREERLMDDTPPQALTRAVDALAARLGLRLALVPAARPHWWSVLGYTSEGVAGVVLPAREEGALYAEVTRWLRPR